MTLKKILLSSHGKLLWRPNCRRHSQKHEYEIPSSYQNAFYLANASLVDSTNWFVHNALRVMYTDLIDELESKGLDVGAAQQKINSVVNIFEPCNNFIDVRFPVKMKNGEYEVFRGFRAQHGLYINKKPCLGGLRLCSKIEKSDIKALASLSTYKYACVGIDMLGAHGGIVLSKNDLEQQELQNVVEAYTLELTKKGFCGDSVDIFEPDFNCSSEVMQWMATANLKSGKGNACAVGKPVSFGGIVNREKAVAQGIFFGLNVFLQNPDVMGQIDLETGWSNKKFIIQGLGNVGSCTGLYLENAGLTCVGIVEHDCHIYSADGLSIQEAVDYKNKHGSLSNFKNFTKFNEPNEILKSDCDILVLAATQNSLLYFVADKIKAKIIVEAANAPISPSVHKIFTMRHKLVLPDIYINSGSSIASYFEYLKHLQDLRVEASESSRSDTNENLLKLSGGEFNTNYGFVNKLSDCNLSRQTIMNNESEKNEVTAAVDIVMQKTAMDIAETVKRYQLGIDIRTAAYVNAIKKLFWAAFHNL